LIATSPAVFDNFT